MADFPTCRTEVHLLCTMDPDHGVAGDAGFTFHTVEDVLNDLMLEGVLGIVNRIVPLDPEYEEMIRNASEGDVDPEVRWAAENMSAELDLGSKEGFIGSTVDTYESVGYGMDDGDPIDSWYDKLIFKYGGKKIALLIGQGGGKGSNNVDDTIHNDMTTLYHILENKGYEFIRGDYNRSEDSTYYNWDYVTTETSGNSEKRIENLFSMLGDNLTTGHEKVVLCFAGHGTPGTYSITELNNGITFSVPWHNIAMDLDNHTLDSNSTPLYEKMIIIVSTCFAGSAMDPFLRQDNSRRVITSSKDDEASWGIGGPFDHFFFLKHFIDYLGGKAWEEFKVTFLQTLLGGTIFACVLGLSVVILLVKSAVPAVAASAGNWGLLTFFVCILAFSLTWAIGAHLQTYFRSALSSVLDDFCYAYKFGRWGLSLTIMGTHPQVSNELLADNAWIM